MRYEKTLRPLFGDKHKRYIEKAVASTMSVAEGAVRAGKTVDNVAAFAACLLRGTPDRIHLATGSTSANAKLNAFLNYRFKLACLWQALKQRYGAFRLCCGAICGKYIKAHLSLAYGVYFGSIVIAAAIAKRDLIPCLKP